MTLPLVAPDVMDVSIRIPKVDFKRMKGIAKVMGWDVFQTERHTATEVRLAQEAYVKETLTRAFAELDENHTSAKRQTLDDFLNELD